MTSNFISFIFMQIAIVLLFVITTFFLVKKITANRFNQKFADFVVTDNEIGDHSLEYKIELFFLYIIKGLSFILNKNKWLKNKSNKYQKYLFLENHFLTAGMDFIALRFLILLLIAIMGLAFLLFSFNYYNLVIVLLLLFFFYLFVNYIYDFKYQKFLKSLNKDLLLAIEVINTALNAGLSVSQALLLVTNKANGILKKEFTNVYNDVTNGLSIESSFKSMYDRLSLNTILYLSTTLQLYSNVGGNINNSFNLLEKDYEKRIKFINNYINLVLPYRFISLLIGFIPLLILAIKLVNNIDILNTIINSWGYISIFTIAIILNIIYFLINNIMMGDEFHVK